MIFFSLLFSFSALANSISEKLNHITTDKVTSILTKQDAEMICLSTAENQFLIGMIHQVPIHASIEKVISVFEDFENYSKIFKDLKQVKIVERSSANDLTVQFESIIPIPFVPNSVYEVHYKAQKFEKPTDYKRYDFKLKKGKDFKSLDGVVFIKKISDSETLYQEIDFIEVDLGIAKSFAKKSIWIDSVTGTFESDYGLKFKSENPKMESKEIIKQSRFSVESAAIQSCLDHKKDAHILF